jgi:hypothetical protein
MAASNEVIQALAGLTEMLAADGYSLNLEQDAADEVVTAEIVAGPDACAECLAPKTMMRTYFESALRDGLGREPPAVRLVYPADAEH